MDMERSLRRLRLACAASLCLSLVAILFAVRSSFNSHIRVRQLDVVDETGATRIRIEHLDRAVSESGSETSQILLMDPLGGVRGFFGSQGMSAQLSLYDRSSKQSAVFGVDGAGPGLLFFDRTGQRRLSMYLESQNNPALEFYDFFGKSRCALALSSNDEPGLYFMDVCSNSRFSTWLDKAGDPWLTMSEATQSGIAFVRGPTSTVAPENESEQYRVLLGLQDRSGFLQLTDTSGRFRLFEASSQPVETNEDP